LAAYAGKWQEARESLETKRPSNDIWMASDL
jgi:hypothetical protein